MNELVEKLKQARNYFDRECVQDAADEYIETIGKAIAALTATNKRMAEHLTDELFKLGSDHTPCKRIQFMGGEYPDKEIPQGGMNRDSMISWFEKRLPANFLTSNEGKVCLTKEDALTCELALTHTILSDDEACVSYRDCRVRVREALEGK